MYEADNEDSLYVLLVDDDPVDIRSVKRAFEKNKLPHFLHFAKDGAEALDMLRGKIGTFPTDQAVPKIILLDLNMPRMGGLEFLAELRSDQNLKSLPIVVLTTSSLECDVRAAFGHHVAGYIVKSFDYREFVENLLTINQYWTLSRLRGHCASPLTFTRQEDEPCL